MTGGAEPSGPAPEVLLLHHVQGLTEGVRAFADGLRAGGLTVHTPDLFEGRTFGSIPDGFAYLESLGEGVAEERAAQAAAALPERLAYVGISLGAMIATRLAVTRPGAAALVMLESAIPVVGEWAFGPFPPGVRVQAHGAEGDEFFQEDLPFAHEMVEALGPERAEVFLYPGDQHLFTDSSLPSYDAAATALVTERVRAFLGR
ncbi:MAG: dienelactone hydrolase family protein [Arachnia sp.]